MVRVRVRSISVCALFAVLSASASLAQKSGNSALIATVGMEATNAFLPGAEIVITDLKRVGKTDWSGEAVVSNVPPGVHTIRVRALGYEPIETQVIVQGDTVGATFLLRRIAVTTDTIFVRAKEVPQNLKGFELRRAAGIGRYMTQAQLDSAANRFEFQTLMAMRFPGLTVRALSDGQHVLSSNRSSCDSDFRRAQGLRIGVPPRSTGCNPNVPCVVPVLLDGIDMQDMVEAVVRTWDLAGAEFYDGAQVPPQYRVSGYACGVLLVWSRRP
jgi:hypothetical protein